MGFTKFSSETLVLNCVYTIYSILSLVRTKGDCSPYSEFVLTRMGPFKRYVTLRGEGGISKNVTERDRGVGGLLLRCVTQGCKHVNKWIY